MATLKVPPLGTRHAPFALGVIVADPADDITATSDARLMQQLAVAVAAHDAGCFLLVALDVGPGESDWSRLWTLAMRTDAEFLFVLSLGSEQREAVESLAAELRLSVREVAPITPSTGIEFPIREREDEDRPAAPGVLAVDLDIPGSGSSGEPIAVVHTDERPW